MKREGHKQSRNVDTKPLTTRQMLTDSLLAPVEGPGSEKAYFARIKSGKEPQVPRGGGELGKLARNSVAGMSSKRKTYQSDTGGTVSVIKGDLDPTKHDTSKLQKFFR